MKTMKKFLRYFILFILLFLWVSGLMYIGTKNMNKENELTQQAIECVTQTTSPVIEITQCKDGILQGTIQNNTDILINTIYVKAEFYDKDNNLLETKYFEIKYFNVGEKTRFKINFSNKNVTSVKVTSVEKIV